MLKRIDRSVNNGITDELNFEMCTFKLSSHICDTTRHDSMRHDTTGDQDTTVFKFGATHTTTRPCDTILTHITNSMTVSWYAVNYHTFSQEDNSSTDKEYSKKG